MPAKFKRKSKGKSAFVPSECSEFLDYGVEQEDHGDRWIDSGDIPKAVRFYQVAYDSYLKAIELAGSNQTLSAQKSDAAYNIARLQLVIYNKLIRTGELAVTLGTREDVGNLAVVPRDLLQVRNSHEEALRIIGEEQPPSDLAFNYAQVMVDLAEEKDDLNLAITGLQAFEKVLNDQLKQLKGNQEQISEENQDSEMQIENEDAKGVLYPGTESTQEPTTQESFVQAVPETVMETLVSMVNSLTTGISIKDVSQEQMMQDSFVNFALQKVFTVWNDFQGLVSQFGLRGNEEVATQQSDLVNNTSADDLLKISSDRLIELLISVAQFVSQFVQNLDEMDKLWMDRAPLQNEESHSTADIQTSVQQYGVYKGMSDCLHVYKSYYTDQWYLAAVDGYFSLIDKIQDPELQWKCYSSASKALNILWDNRNDQTSGKVLRQVWITKGDIEILRSKLKTAAAEKNGKVLVNNARVFYRNGAVAEMDLKKVSGINPSSNSKTLGLSLHGDMETRRMINEAKVKLLLLDDKRPEIQSVQGWQVIMAQAKDQGLTE